MKSQPLQAILGGTAQAKDGMAKFVFAKRTKAHGLELGPEMGVNDSQMSERAGAGSTAARNMDLLVGYVVIVGVQTSHLTPPGA